MKKYFLITVLICLVVCCSVAQNKSIEYGVQSGMNINSGRGIAIIKDKVDKLTGLGVGVHIKINLSPSFGIKAMLHYDQNGYAYRDLVFADNIGTTIGSSVC